MQIVAMKTRNPSAGRIFQAGVCILLLTLVAGCLGNYGRYQRDAEILQAFNNSQVPLDYRYYYYGLGSEAIAVIGVEKKYDAGSRMWLAVEPNSEKFNNLVYWIWEDYGYSPFAARILDPSGNPVGVLFTSIREVAIKFTDDNRIVVMPHTPFLWGPGVEFNSEEEYFGRADSNTFSSIPHRASF